MTEKELVLMADPSPAGYRYGFPRPVPQYVLDSEESEDTGAFVEWLVECGYPREWAEDGICRYWYVEAEE